MFGITQIKDAVTDVKSFLGKAVSDVSEVVKLWNAIQNNGTKALILKIAGDVLSEVSTIEGAASAGGLNFTLDEACVTGAQQLIADAKAGKASAVADLQALGLDLPKTAAAAPTAAAAAPVAAAPVVAAPAPAPTVDQLMSALASLVAQFQPTAASPVAIPAAAAAAAASPALHEVVPA